MRSATTSFPVSRFIAASLMLVIGAVLWLTTSMARAQTVAGYSGSGQAITAVTSKGAGQADVTITGEATSNYFGISLDFDASTGLSAGVAGASLVATGFTLSITPCCCAGCE